MRVKSVRKSKASDELIALLENQTQSNLSRVFQMTHNRRYSAPCVVEPDFTATGSVKTVQINVPF